MLIHVKNLYYTLNYKGSENIHLNKITKLKKKKKTQKKH